MMKVYLIIAIILILLFIITIVRSLAAKKQKSIHTIKREDISDSSRMIKFNELQGQKPLKRFLVDYPSYSKEKLENEFINIAQSLSKLENDKRISPKLLQIMCNDTGIKKISQMKVQRANFINYNDQMIFAIAVFSDKYDEYVMNMRFIVNDNGLYLIAADILLGSKTNLIT